MKVDYIKSLSEAYLLDAPQDNIVPEDLFEHFYGMLKDLRENQTDLYTLFDSMNRFEQQQIFKKYFNLVFEQDNIVEINDEDLDNIEILDELEFFSGSLALLILKIGIALIGLIHFRKPLSKAIFKVLSGIANVINRIGKRLSTYGGSTRLAWSIIQNNSEKCYKLAGFNPQDASFSSYLSQYPDDLAKEFSRFFTTSEEEHQMDTLRECYLYTLEEVIKLTASNYFLCLHNTKSLSRLPLERDYETFTKVIMSSSIHESCDEFFDVFNEAFKKYGDVLQLVYPFKDDVNKIRERKINLMSAIYNLQKDTLNNKTTSNNYKVAPPPQQKFSKKVVGNPPRSLA